MSDESSNERRDDSTTSAAAGAGGAAAEPDADTIKMFVGQVPRAWNEEDCKKFFEEFGPVHSLNVLRDRSNNVSKGCCFVTFFHRKDALCAQNTLHNVRVLPGMHHAMQVKPADVENQRKLFIGMLGKGMSESDVRAAFQEFGQIEDCTVLRDPEGKSRGCGFLTFVTRNCAQLAIRKMHQAKTFEGCTKPVVVKFADTPKDKENKKSALAFGAGANGGAAGGALSRLLAPAGAGAAANPTAALLAQLLQAQQPQQQSAANQLLSGLQALLPLLTAAQQQSQIPQQQSSHRNQQQQQQQSSFSSQQMSELLQQQKLMELLNSSKSSSANKNDATSAQLAQLLLSAQNGASSASPPRYNNNAAEPDYFQAQQQPTQQQQQQSVQSTLLTQLQAFAQMGGGGGTSSSSANASSAAAAQATDYASLLAGGYGTSAAAAAGQSKGPDGCNLFIYHLPQDFSDHELNALFALFGNVLSAKVFIDKQTNMSKCFGFVSYDNAASAQKAISGMNGFQIGSKRLKVQVKRGKDKPYQRGGSGASPQPRNGSVSPTVNALVNNFFGAGGGSAGVGAQKYAYDE